MMLTGDAYLTALHEAGNLTELNSGDTFKFHHMWGFEILGGISISGIRNDMLNREKKR